MASLIVFVA